MIEGKMKMDSRVKGSKSWFSVIPAQAVPPKAGQSFHALRIFWIPVFTGMTTFYEFIKIEKVTFKILTSFFMGVFMAGGVVLIEPGLSSGQPKKRTVISREGRKDPFSLPSGVRLLSKEISVQPAQEDKKITGMVTPEIKLVEASLKLKAILITDHVRLASIDRSIVTVGDSINDEKVLEIRPDRVVLGKEGKRRTILLDQSPVKLTVEER